MTGLFGRFRSWVGSLFGSASEREDEPERETDATAESTVESTDVTAAKLAAAIEQSESDAESESERETTTPTTDSTEESNAAEPSDVTAAKLAAAIERAESTPTTKTVRHERDDAAVDAEKSPFELEGGPKTVRIPSDETADEEGTEADATADDAAADEDSEPTPTDFDYRCTVCGTGVETPDDPCPLCRSSEIVPTDDAGDVYESAGDDSATAEASEQVGQKTTSISDADDAVERLRTLRGDEE